MYIRENTARGYSSLTEFSAGLLYITEHTKDLGESMIISLGF